ncbi:ankyrin repeat-containing domain protein [Mycena olivaceomarginata]|nr:ankyrin repeat-containing domain protein [Mycena olivaceomarginata]
MCSVGNNSNKMEGMRGRGLKRPGCGCSAGSVVAGGRHCGCVCSPRAEDRGTGAGKTIICSTVIEDILAIPGDVLAYFYFYYGEADKQSLRGMLSSIISQLEEKLLDAPSPLLTLYQKLGSGAHQPRIPELTACLKSLIITLSARPIFIVLDALDECSKPDELAPVLCDLLQWAEGRLHVFVTSRPEDAVVKVLRPLMTCELDLSSVIQGDISLYLGRIMSKEHPFRSWKQVHRDCVLNHLLKHSGGMFRWVICQLDDLRKCLLRDLQITLNNLPTTLDATYERILSRIHATNKPHARRLFNWLAFSFRPLHVEELAQVLAIDFTDDASATYEEDYVEPDPREAISRVCLSLVHITPDGIVQFTHFSVKEFFMSERIQSIPSVSLFWIEARMAHTIIAASVSHIFYGVRYAVHAQFNRLSDNVRHMLGSLFIEDSRQWTFWVSHNRELYHSRNNAAGPPLYWAAKLGFLHIMRLLLERGADVNAQGGRYGNALQAASKGGHLDLAQLLVERGAAVNAQGGRYGNALQAALARGHLDLAQLLLECGADVNAQGGVYGNALQAASQGGHLDLAQLLLERGADVNTQGGWYGNALQAAAERGHLLLGTAAARGGLYGNALHTASARGHLDLAQLLLERGADVNAQGGEYGNALQAASQGGHLDLAQLLLERGADVNTQGGWYGNALQAAAKRGHLDLAQLLLECGADVNAQGGLYGNALHTASARGHLDLAQLLLERGADVNAQGGEYGNALHTASARGHLDLAQQLLERGADVNAQGGLYGNALHAASARGHLDLTQLLLEGGADVNAQGGRASARGHLDLAQLLLECGADVNAQGGESKVDNTFKKYFALWQVHSRLRRYFGSDAKELFTGFKRANTLSALGFTPDPLHWWTL